MKYSNDSPITSGQKIALRKLIMPQANGRDALLFVISALIGREINSTNELTVGDWRKIRNSAYPYWQDDNDEPDWTVGHEFKATVAGWCELYREQVIGQQRLF